MHARGCYKELLNLYSSIQLDQPPTPDSVTSGQVAAWKRVFQWECGNHLQLADPEALHARIMFAYKLGISQLRFSSQIWFSLASYLISAGKGSEAAALFGIAVGVLPQSLLINLAYANFEETKGDVAASKTVYDNLLERLGAEIAEFCSENFPDVTLSEVESEKDYAKVTELLGKHPRLHELVKNLALLLTQMMRFSRRTEGIKGARAIFSKARKQPFCTPHVFATAALMEWHCNKDAGIAVKIFELGLKRYCRDRLFVREYLTFLIAQNDDNNTRSLFERVIVHHEDNQELWGIYLGHVYRYGDLEEMQKLEKRKIEVQSALAMDDLNSFALRYTTFDLTLECGEAGTSNQLRTPSEDTPRCKEPQRPSDPIGDFLKILPPPEAFDGPLVNPGELMLLLSLVNIPESAPRREGRDRRASRSSGIQKRSSDKRRQAAGRRSNHR